MTSATKLFKSLFPNSYNDKLEPPLQKLTEEVENHGWCLSTGTTHFSLCKEYKFDSKKEASIFLVDAISEKNSSHVHVEVTLEKTSILDVSIYSDDNNHDDKCLELCLELDEKFEDHSGSK